MMSSNSSIGRQHEQPCQEGLEGMAWGICTRGAGKLCSARSLLYRRLRVREWSHLAFFEIYKIFTPSHRSEPKMSAKTCHIFFVFFKIIFHDLQDIHAFAPLQTQNFRKILPFFFSKFSNFCKILIKFC